MRGTFHKDDRHDMTPSSEETIRLDCLAFILCHQVKKWSTRMKIEFRKVRKNCLKINKRSTHVSRKTHFQEKV